MINILGYVNVAVGTANLVFGVTTSDITLAKKYKSKKRLQFIIDNIRIPSILRDWKVYEVEE